MIDALGDYMKLLERSAETRAERGKPLCARLDGRAFHTFTKGLARPYDRRMSDAMVFAAMELVRETNALLGYTQSDEISLVWHIPEGSPSQYMFDGRHQKLCSILASIATGSFRQVVNETIPEKRWAKPLFDCRVWQVPTLSDAFLMFKWRELDAIKNSITMAAQAHYSHSRLHGIGSGEKLRLLRDLGEPWEDEPEFFRRGTYVKRVKTSVSLSEEELARIPLEYRPEGRIVRTVVKPVSFPYMSNMEQDYMKLFEDCCDGEQ